MNNLVTIKNVRGYIDEKGVAFLNLEDVARGLGFTRIANSGNEVIRWERVRKYLSEISVPTSGHEEFDYRATSGAITATQVSPFKREGFIPENIFYKLCMKANNEVARKFQDLVCDEILPSIRQNGGYIATSEDDTDDVILAKAVLLAQKTIEKKNREIRQLTAKNQELKNENEVQKQVIEDFKPVQEYIDIILGSADALAISQIAADYGMSGAELNKILHKQGLIRKINGQWLLYKEHMGKGYTQSSTFSCKTVVGIYKTVVTTYWTQKGRLKIHEILTKLGIKANMDK